MVSLPQLTVIALSGLTTLTIADHASSYAFYHPIFHHTKQHGHDYYAPPKYAYKYGVKDPHTHDHKDQWEEREGDVVHGGYSFAQPDGRFRKVTYTSDKENGFNAHVYYEHAHGHHPQHYGYYGGGQDNGGGSGGQNFGGYQEEGQQFQ